MNTRMPSLFIPHGGGPCFFMDWNPPDAWSRMRAFLEGLSATLPAQPKAILLISAHWVTPEPMVQQVERPSLIYDYYGFPPHTYELTYPAQGDANLSQRALALLQGAGLAAGLDQSRGYDHGAFIPLKLIYPKANVPIVQLSLHAGLSAARHLAMGAALAPLRDEGVLILGSGFSFHNLRVMFQPHAFPQAAENAAAFDAWLSQTVLADPARLAHWEEAPHARLAHPHHGEEHLLPLMVAAGAALGEPGAKIYEGDEFGLRNSAFRFG